MREPDLIIGGAANPYLLRWWVIPRNRFFNIYLHKIVRDDDDRALHDHPWWSISLCLKGKMCEVAARRSIYQNGKWEYDATDTERHIIRRFQIRIRPAKLAHRLVLAKNKDGFDEYGFPAKEFYKPCWTLFITGPKIREWGFHCPQGWTHWKFFTNSTGEAVGKGCAE